jgi:type I restriction enzyme S subunit
MSDNCELPKGWVNTSLAAIGKLYCGQSPSVSEVNHSGKGTPYVTGPDQWDGSALTVDKWTTNPKRVVPDGCIFITVKGAGVGTLFAGVACAIGRDVYAYEPANGLSRKFIEHSLRYNILQILQHAKGDIPGLSKDHILGHQTSFPPLNEQHRIVAKIEELFSDLDAGVAALKRAKANLKRYRAAVLKAAVEGKLTEEWRATHPTNEPASALLARILKERRQKWEAEQLARFTAAGKEPPKSWREKYVEPSPPVTSGLPELPDGWCWASVEQTSEVQGGIQKQPKRAPGVNSFPFLRVANVHRNRLELGEVHRIELFGSEIERLRLQTGDLLVVEGNGSKTEIGRSAIWTGEIEDCVHQNHIIRVRFLAGSSRYLNSYWNSPLGNGRVMEQAASTSGLYTLSVTKVCSLPVPLAPTVEQEQIVAEVEERLSVISAAECEISNSLRRVDRLRQSILKQAFEGKLVPQDPRDEPASVLLDRLRANRAVHEGNGKAATQSRPRGRRGKSQQLEGRADE